MSRIYTWNTACYSGDTFKTKIITEPYVTVVHAAISVQDNRVYSQKLSYTQTESYSTSIEIKSVTSGCKKSTWWKIESRLNAWFDECACWKTFIKVRPDRLHKGHPGESTWPGVLTILMTIIFVHQISQIATHTDISSCVTWGNIIHQMLVHSFRTVRITLHWVHRNNNWHQYIHKNKIQWYMA